MLEKEDKAQCGYKYSFIVEIWHKLSGKVIIFIFVSLISVALKMCFAVLVSEIVDRAVNGELNILRMLFGGLLLFLIVRYGTSRLYSKVKITVLQEARACLRKKLMNQFLQLSLSAGREFQSYENIVVTDVDMIVNDYYKSMLDLLENLMTLLVALIILVKTNFVIAFNILLFTGIQLLIPKIYNKKLVKARGKYVEKSESHYRLIKEIALIRPLLYSEELTKHQQEKYKNVTDSLKQAAIDGEYAGEKMRILTFVLSQFMYLSTMILGAFLAVNGYMSIGMVVAASQFMNYITSPLSEIITDIGLIRAASVAKDKVETVLTMKTDSECLKIDLAKRCDGSENILKISGVSLFSEDGKVCVLDNINLTIKRGEKVLIIGESGAGKSSLAKIIMKELIPSQGTVFLNGMNLEQLNDSVIHMFLSYIPATPLVFEGNLNENITLYRTYTDRNQQFVKLFGMEGNQKKNVLDCSMGEQQRINIIRALLENKPIIIADESTSHLDKDNRRMVEQTIVDFSESLIFISHHFDKQTMAMFDRVLELKNGKLVYDGKPS